MVVENAGLAFLSLVMAVCVVFITVLIHVRGEYKSLGNRFERLINEGKKAIHEEERFVINQLREEISKPEPDFEEIINLVNWISLLRGSLEKCKMGFEKARRRENQYLLGIILTPLLLASLVMFILLSGVSFSGIEIVRMILFMIFLFTYALSVDYGGTMRPLKDEERAATQYFTLRLKEES